jgi:hypothetical protein
MKWNGFEMYFHGGMYMVVLEIEMFHENWCHRGGVILPGETPSVGHTSTLR